MANTPVKSAQADSAEPKQDDLPGGMRAISDDKFGSTRGVPVLLPNVRHALANVGKSFAIDINEANGSADKIMTQLYRAFKSLPDSERDGFKLRTSKHDKVTANETPYVALRVVADKS